MRRYYKERLKRKTVIEVNGGVNMAAPGRFSKKKELSRSYRKSILKGRKLADQLGGSRYISIGWLFAKK